MPQAVTTVSVAVTASGVVPARASIAFEFPKTQLRGSRVLTAAGKARFRHVFEKVAEDLELTVRGGEQAGVGAGGRGRDLLSDHGADRHLGAVRFLLSVNACQRKEEFSQFPSQTSADLGSWLVLKLACSVPCDIRTAPGRCIR